MQTIQADLIIIRILEKITSNKKFKKKQPTKQALEDLFTFPRNESKNNVSQIISNLCFRYSTGLTGLELSLGPGWATRSRW